MISKICEVLFDFQKFTNLASYKFTNILTQSKYVFSALKNEKIWVVLLVHQGAALLIIHKAAGELVQREAVTK
ncbi:MAG: hypothetical protein OHK0045_00630 [Raineya sp.]